jgi:actin-related protein
MEEAMDLDEIICQSICAVESADMRKRLASQIVLVGGVAKSEKLVDWLEDNIFNKIRNNNGKFTTAAVSATLATVISGPRLAS